MKNNNYKSWKTRKRIKFISSLEKTAITTLLVALFPFMLFLGYITPGIPVKAENNQLPVKYQVKLPKAENKPYTLPDKKLVKQLIGEVSAYTLGRVEENDSEPCIGASGENMCEMAKNGMLMFANNYYKLGTLVCIETVGCGVVKDRMNPRYNNKKYFDIAGLDKNKNINFGRKNLIVRVYKK